MIGRADIEGSKSNVAMNAWLPQASYYTLPAKMVNIFVGFLIYSLFLYAILQQTTNRSVPGP